MTTVDHDKALTWLHAAMGGQHDPFPWQKRLLRTILAGAPPRALDLPTGLGKTSVMAIWLVARACGARHLPRRLVYVVDRRAVVDQATTVAESLAAWVASNPEVQAGLGVAELPISTLRGQFVDNKRWLDDPSVPAIVVGTVDMIGSRVLFSGYACSRKMRPYHAGFLGCDALFVLDEAHLVPPFEHLLEGTGAPAFWPTAAAGTPSTLLALSATGRSYASPFRLDPEDRAHPIVQKRVRAVKRITWRDVPASSKLAEALADSAWELASSSERPRRILVFSNSRDDALKAREAVDKRGRAEKLPVSTELLVGGRRVHERVHAAQQLERLGFLAGEQREPLVAHSFLFTTSAGEVGVDLDADDAVADVVAWERMVQRLGRVNRRGDGDARVVLVAHPGQPKPNEWLESVRALVQRLPQGDDGAWLAGPDALATLKDEALPEEVAAASTPEPLYPPLALPLVEAWSMTSLKVHTGRPEVGPWLRGWIEEDVQTALLWRSLLPPTQRGDYLEAAPPHAAEKLETPTHRVVSWLTARADRIGRRGNDEPSIPPSDEVVWVLDDAGELEATRTLRSLQGLDAKGKERLFASLAGKQVLLDQRMGGLTDGLLDDKADDAPSTVEDWAPAGGRPVVPFRVLRVPGARESIDDAWNEVLRVPYTFEGEDVTSWLVVDRYRGDPSSEESRSASRPQLLVEHQAWAADEADRIATALDLPADLHQALVIAARFHDEGKKAARWQRAFNAPSDGAYAKTRGPVRVRWLDGYRHELGSLPVAEASPEVQALPVQDRELVLHLIAAHHGSARPTIRTSGCDDAPPSVVEGRARDVALRFVELQGRWGPWRLAWLESLLRAADQTASRRNDQGVK